MCDQRLAGMDDDDHVSRIKQPDGSILSAPVRVASNGGAISVHSIGEDRKSAYAPVCSGKFKKQQASPGKNVWRANKSSFADAGPAFALTLIPGTTGLISARLSINGSER